MKRKKNSAILFLAIVFLLISSLAFAEKTPPEKEKQSTASPWFEFGKGPYMTGDWAGLRTKLAEKGFDIEASYVCDILGNPVGGMDKSVRYDHSIGFDINFDFGKVSNLKGTQIHGSGLYRYGRNISAEDIGNVLTATSIYGSEQVRLYNLYIDQTLFDNHLNIRAGRISAGDDFASSPLYWVLVNNGIDGNPISLPLNLFFSTYPTAVWGGRAKINFTNEFYSTTGVYNGDPQVGDNRFHGTDFRIRDGRGVFYIEELGYTPNTAKDAKGMPGHYKIGAYYHSARFDDLYEDDNGNSYVLSGLAQKRHRGNYGMYLHADQMVYREGGPGSDQGLTPFLAATFAPDNINQYPFFIDGGLIYKGLLPGRDQDTAAFGFAYIKWSNEQKKSQRDLAMAQGISTDPQEYEAMIEFTYIVQLMEWLFVQPDLQYIMNPGGRGDINDALVLGTRLKVVF